MSNFPSLHTRLEHGFCNCGFINKLVTAVFFLLTGAVPTKADLNVSYSVGDMFVAAYDLPPGVPAGMVHLATLDEYIALGADAPFFYSNINVIDRGSAKGELFMSTRVLVNDPIFDLLFVRSDTGEAVGWYRIEAAKGNVRIQQLNYVEPTTPTRRETPSDRYTDYHNANKQTSALLAEVSRQLSEAKTLPFSEEVTQTAPSSASKPANVVPKREIPTDGPILNEDSHAPAGQAVFYVPERPQLAVVSEVHLATANLKNFILTILVAGLALLLAIALILYKIRAIVTASPGRQQPQEQPLSIASSDQQASASGAFLNFIKEENKRNQETYLKSIEFLAASKVGVDTSGQVTLEPSSNPGTQIAFKPSEQVQKRSINPQRPINAPSRENAQNLAPANVSSPSSKGAQQNLSDKTTPSAVPDEISAQVQEKLDLAEVYGNMGDIFVASNLLKEVIKTGNATEVAKARAALQKIGEI